LAKILALAGQESECGTRKAAHGVPVTTAFSVEGYYSSHNNIYSVSYSIIKSTCSRGVCHFLVMLGMGVRFSMMFKRIGGIRITKNITDARDGCSLLDDDVVPTDWRYPDHEEHHRIRSSDLRLRPPRICVEVARLGCG
jgi:hypothetical protein